jgi:glycerol-3-phosphate dehydrogenase (NAD(P)+)
MIRVTILGAGSWGTALATLLPGCERVSLWARHSDLAAQIQTDRENLRYLPDVALPANVVATSHLAASVKDAECVVLAVPSAGMREVVALAAPFIRPGTLLVSAAKGLEASTGRRMSEVIADVLTQSPPRASQSSPLRLSALSGPNLAVEVARGIPTASVAASDELEAASACQSLFMGPTFRVYTSTDLLGVELAGAMKNVIAIAAGVCEGIGFGDNARAALMTRGLAEITRLGMTMGARQETFLGLAGVGDLIATGGSRLSRNYRVGVGLGQGKSLPQVLGTIGQVAEGVPTTSAICLLAQRYAVDMPISQALHAALFEGVDPRQTIPQLMLRPPKSEAGE